MNERNPDRYRRLSVPKESPEKANADMAAFAADLLAIREKHGIRDVVYIVEMDVVRNGEEKVAACWGHLGDPLKSESMLAYVLGVVQTEHRHQIGRMLTGKDWTT